MFQDIIKSEPPDPMEAARRNVRPARRKRFYKEATVTAHGTFEVMLDSRPVHTPASRPLAAPSRELAQAISQRMASADRGHRSRAYAAYAACQFAPRRLADNPGPVRVEVVKYLGSDLLFYRADGPEKLTELQAEVWDPVVEWAAKALGARFILVEGVVFAAQPELAVAAAAKSIPTEIWRLGAVHSVTTLTGSALLALALSEGAINVEQAWAAANVDEDWQMTQWGRDKYLAMERRAHRKADMDAAAKSSRW